MYNQCERDNVGNLFEYGTNKPNLYPFALLNCVYLNILLCSRLGREVDCLYIQQGAATLRIMSYDFNSFRCVFYKDVFAMYKTFYVLKAEFY